MDESDAGATPAVPGGTGLSLQEAIVHVNGLAAARTIRFIGPMTISANGKPWPFFNAPGASIVGGRVFSSISTSELPLPNAWS